VIRSDVILYLYDVLDGGPARAFLCKLDKSGKPCGAVTRTLTGMRTHPRVCHSFRPQAKLSIRMEVSDGVPADG
jgi:hypothetical protein